MGGASVGEIQLDMILNSAQFRQQMNNVRNQAETMGTKISGSFKKIGVAIATAFSVAAIKKFGQECIESAASVQASNSQFAQTFGDLQTQANQAMKAVADESKITQSRLQDVGTSIFAFAKTTGMDSAQALTMMQDALKVTADSAAYYDRSLEDTAESLKSFLKGNYENDSALGLSCTETTRNIAANKLYGKSFKDLSESQKQLTLLEMVKDANKLSGALGQASRESDGWENVLGNLKETWNQFLAVIGKPILQGAITVIQGITSAISTLTEYAKSAVSALSELFGWNTDNANTTQQIATNTANTSENIADSTENQKALNEESNRGVASFDKLNVLSKQKSNESSSRDISNSNPNISSVVDSAKQVEKSTKNIFSNAFKDFYEKSGFKNFVSEVQKGIDNVDWGSIKNNCVSAFKSTIPITVSTVKGTQKVAQSAFGAVGKVIGGMVTTTGKSIKTASGGIAKWLEKDNSKIVGFIDTVTTNFANGFDNIGTFSDKWFSLMGQSIDNVRPEMESAISDFMSGLTDFGGAVATVFSEGFSIASGSLVKWVDEDGAEILSFFENLQLMISDTMTLIGDVFSDIGTTISGWWDSDGVNTFQSICDMFTNIGTTFMNIWNEWIKPVWDFIVDTLQSAWDNCLHPIFDKLLSFFGKVGECISTIWNNFLSPIVNWFVDVFGPVISNVLSAVGGVFDTVFTAIGDVVGGILDAFGGLIDFITGVFSGNWEKAWQGICDFFTGIWNGIWGVIKGVINLIIDAINLLWTAIYTAVAGIVNALGGIVKGIGSLFGQEWGWEMPTDPPLIPKLAKGGIVKAPTLAVVGDNAGANTGDPEVISPLSKLQGMINKSSGQDVVILTQILDYLKRIYEMFIIFRNQGGNTYEFVAKINGSEIFDEIVKQNELYKKRHGGKSAFA